jgi:hypothetical protein
MALQGNIVNGKFVDMHGMVYQIMPPGAEILNSTDGSDTKDTQNTKNTTPSNGNGNSGNKTKQPTSNPPTPPATPLTPKATEQTQPPAAPASQPQTPPPISPNISPNNTYPKCISFEILRAVQTPSMAQVSVRAHCKGQFADAVVHYDFEVYEQAPDTNIITFKQTALQSAHAEAVQIAKKLLCEQNNGGK